MELIHRKNRLILTTVEVMNDLGIQGLSTREIAKRQGVSEATLFRHFKNKNELLLSVIDYYAQFDSDIIATARLKMDKPLQAITFLFKAYTEYYENYPAITAIHQSYDVLSNNPDLGKKIKNIFITRGAFLKELIGEAQNKGEIPAYIDSEKLTDVLVGLSREIILKWRFSQNSFSLKEYTLSTIDMVLSAFLVNK